MKSLFNVSVAALSIFVAACSFGISASAADTEIYDNSQVNFGGYYYSGDIGTYTEYLDFGYTSGGNIKQFTIGYYAPSSSSVTFKVRFYKDTSSGYAPGTNLKTFTLSNLPGYSGGGFKTYTYIIPSSEQFDLSSGNFGYSIESYSSGAGPWLAKGGSGNQNLIWYYEDLIDDWWSQYYSVTGDPWAGFYLKLVAGEVQTCSFSGYVYEDLAEDGSKSAGDPGLEGWKVFVDGNGNRKCDIGEPNDITDSNGYYSISSVPIGSVDALCQITRGGWKHVNPASGYYQPSVSANGSYVFNFGNKQYGEGSVSGYKFDDANANGAWDGGEAVLEGWRIYIDLNKNGQFEATEPNDITDPNGFYEIPGLEAPGDYTVAEVMKPDWNQTLPGGDGTYTISAEPNTVTANVNFGNTTEPIAVDIHISGRITASDGSGVEGVEILAEGIETVSVLTDSNGNYTITLSELWSGTITPSKDCWAFNPNLKSYTAVSSDMTDQDFTGTRTCFYGGGDGTEADPYQICSADHFNEVGFNPDHWSSHFIVMADIDMSGYSYDRALIGYDEDDTNSGFQGTGFTGVFDGNGHVISNVVIDTSGLGQRYLGVFGKVQGSNTEISKLGISNIQIITGNESASIGGFCSLNSGRISNCYTKGLIRIGDDSHAIGGFCGQNSGPITNCYSMVSASCEDGSYSFGGFCGISGYGNDSEMVNCYSTGASDSKGFCHSRMNGHIRNCFWDVETSGIGAPGDYENYAAGKSTIEMQTLNTFTERDWDFIFYDGDPADWYMPDGGYPVLAWEVNFDPKYAGGSGVKDDPYMIATIGDWDEFEENSDDWDAYFILLTDINLIGRTYTHAPIASDDETNAWYNGTEFSGGFDGNNHIIRNLTINGDSYCGLFGMTSGAEVKNLGLENVSITCTGQVIGGLVGMTGDSSIITNCYSTGDITGKRFVGGLAGYSQGSITNCYAEGSAQASENEAGGLAGFSSGSVTSCYSTTSVKNSGNFVGGLLGNNNGNVTNCYSTGSVDGLNTVGGLVGFNGRGNISSCYSIGQTNGTGSDVGGLVGENYFGSITGCFWDIQTSGTTDGAGNENPDPSGLSGKITSLMQTRTTFIDSGWDFFDDDGDPADWYMPYGDYPILRWQINFEPKYFAGSGVQADPYVIASIDDWDVLEASPDDWACYFLLVTDIDLAGRTYTKAPIAGDSTDDKYFQGTEFTGYFDGNGHVISNLTIDGAYYCGLFGNIDGAKILKLGLNNVSITASGVYVGGLVGSNGRDSLYIFSCYVTGTISGVRNVGGLIGSKGFGPVKNSYSVAIVTGDDNVGGLVGADAYFGRISNCYSASIVNSSGENFGGLVGYVDGSIDSDYYYVHSCINRRSNNALDEFQLLDRSSYAGFDFVGDSSDGTDDYWAIEPGYMPKLSWQDSDGFKPLYALDSITTTLSGTGYVDDPFIIANYDDLMEFKSNSSLRIGHYSLINDIDLGGITYTEAFIPEIFGGSFHGNGNKLLNLTIEGVERLGFFDTLYYSVDNLVLENVSITATGDYIGGLVAYNDCGKIKGCKSTGTIIGKGDVGGLVGKTTGLVSNCNTSGIVSGTQSVGGIAGSLSRDDFGSGNVVNCDSTCNVSGDTYIGGLAGYNYGYIAHSYSTGQVTGSGNQIGGLVGWNRGGAYNCYATGKVEGEGLSIGGLLGSNSGGVTNCSSTGDVTGGGKYVGGLIGFCDTNQWLSRNYSTGSVNGNGDCVGGLIGKLDFSNMSECYATGNVVGSGDNVGGLTGYCDGGIQDCYFQGHVTGQGDYVGGLIGYSDGYRLMDSYFTGTVSGQGDNLGGLIGRFREDIYDSFWNIETSEVVSGIGNVDPDPEGVTGKTITEMHTLSTFTDAGWNFDGVWNICDGLDYPRLKWQIPAGDFVCPYGVDKEDLDVFMQCWLENVNMDADVSGNGVVNLEDIANLAGNWMADCSAGCAGDVNADSSVNEDDLNIVANQWLKTDECKIADLSGDDSVNLEDWAIFCSNWLQGTTP